MCFAIWGFVCFSCTVSSSIPNVNNPVALNVKETATHDQNTTPPAKQKYRNPCKILDFILEDFEENPFTSESNFGFHGGRHPIRSVFELPFVFVTTVLTSPYFDIKSGKTLALLPVNPVNLASLV